MRIERNKNSLTKANLRKKKSFHEVNLISNKKPERKSKISKDKNIKVDKKIKIEFNIFELNSFNYKDAIIYD